MADEMVRKAQSFVNNTYDGKLGIGRLPEDGKTSWSLMFALTRALQYELGIANLSDAFGPTTLSALTSKYPLLNEGNIPSKDFARIIQSGLYAKGYDGGDIDGSYNSRVKASMSKLKEDMGVDFAYPGSYLTPKVFKGLLNMDAYVTVNNGSEAIRSVQKWLNGQYVQRRDFFIIPCDGHNSRDVSKSMLFAVQYELGMADGTANGVFGPGTQAGLKEHPLSTGSSGPWVYLFTGAMVLNKRPVSFSSSFTSSLSEAVGKFQSFAKLPTTGKGDFQTWASLLVSYGDQSRKGEACDGVTKITSARAQALKAEGIKYIGRYLTNLSATSLPEKAIQPGELQTIADHGLRCFPIYQTFGRDASGFNFSAGRAAGYAAINAAVDHGFKSGTRIFFAVDFDALDQDVTNNVLPHFKGISDSMSDAGNPYEVGVYGPRNVCTRVAEAGHSTASFVSDMSSGFSGNFGYPLPSDWAYDQIVTRTVGSGDGKIEIDNNIASGRDTGQGSFNKPRGVIPDVRFNGGYLTALSGDISKYMRSIGFPDDGGSGSDARLFTHKQCFETVMSQDELITDLSHRYKMRKALIQTTTYWEMRHYDLVDQGVDHAVALYHLQGIGNRRDSSTGIAQISGEVCIRAWNHGIKKGYVEGPILDPAKDADIWTMWQKVNKDHSFSVTTVSLIHLWGVDGKPGGENPPGGETTLRSMRLDYTEGEIYQVLRRYQGWGNMAEEHATKRMALYQILEKYNGIVRNL
ncbi:Putative peptidoglycan binding domain protein [Streptomyces sp. YIM 121038]|uniref:glycoside hydrolase domain-containing protein n=1 Tax=Streptomyces sp. YIM 121038 TaxID=2136401 RepID=UPI00111032BC|nr:glycoside hydrolase domain-containing protein [Streptomyces sp. YIM 121038]QCX77883.1 Putative peptidoglycan binding domain protein [Streptomyces sp. YIM 121038]